MLEFFSPNYAESRARFRAAVKAANYARATYPIDAKGPQDEDLTIDVACCDGKGAPERVVILTSGLHGTEGTFGSAVQLAWLETEGRSWRPPAGVRVVLAHALNPYGFAWRRRWDENNIDLNRNYLIDRDFLARDPQYAHARAAYARFDGFLNPPTPPSRLEPYTFLAMRTILSAGRRARDAMPADQRPSWWNLRSQWRLGLTQLRKTLPVGQYEHPRGLFFGGPGPAQTTSMIQAQLREWVGSAALAVHIDVHTGLGRSAEYKLLLDDQAESPTARWAAKHFGAEFVEPLDDGPTAYVAHGSIGQYFRSALPGCQYHYLCAEFGTYSPMRVLGALRAENRAHHHGRDRQAYEWTKRNVVEVFCPASARWRSAALKRALRIVQQALAAGGRVAKSH